MPMDAEAQHGAVLLQRGLLSSFVQTISTCDALRERENAALRAQVHDLTELLAAFDLCELQNPHLINVRDRAFQRDNAPAVELLRVYNVKRQLQQEALQNALDNEQDGEASEIPGHIENNLSVVEKPALEVESLQQRVELLERELVILQLRQELLEETTPRLECPAGDTVADPASQDEDPACPSSSAGSDTVEHDRAEVERLVEQEERVIFEERVEETTRTMQKQQQQRIIDLENALATELAKNFALQQQNRRYQEVENILQQFNRYRSTS